MIPTVTASRCTLGPVQDDLGILQTIVAMPFKMIVLAVRDVDDAGEEDDDKDGDGDVEAKEAGDEGTGTR